MKKTLHLLVMTLFLMASMNAQPSVAICGWDGSGSASSGDEVSFVLLRDFVEGEIIYITEDEYSDASNNFLFGEGHIAFTVPAGGLLNNEVVNISETSSGIYADQCGSGGTAVHVAGSGGWSLVSDGLGGCTDEIYIYSASDPNAPWSSITELHSFAWASNAAIPSDQDPSSDWPSTIIVAYNLGGVAGINADFLDAARVEPTIPIFLNSANWNSGSSSLTLSCTNFTNQMLPIELISFDAMKKDRKVLLEWITASEINNDRFEVEHSTDGQNFTAIGTMKGKGTSNVKNSYKYMHHFPYNGINYYRLKQVDYDGAFSYSEIKAVSLRSDKTMATAFPNPFDQNLTIPLPLDDNSSAGVKRTIEIYDVFGKLVHSSVLLEESNSTLDLSNLSSGTFLLYMRNGQSQHSIVQRIVKL